MEKESTLINIFLRNKSLFTGWSLLLFSLLLFVLVANFDPPASEYRVISPSFFPYLLTSVLTLLSFLLIREGWKTPPGRILSIDLKKSDTYRTLALLFLLVGFSALLTTLGFIFDSLLFMVAVQILLGERNMIRVPIMALFVAVGLYFIFAKLFYVPLPTAPW